MTIAMLLAVTAVGDVSEVGPEVSPATNAVVAASGAAPTTNEVSSVKISSNSTYYDRKEGFACFTGNVCVEDPEYRMHANRAFVFMDGTNALKRIIAIGNVALTNGTKRAYGIKASYYRNPGMVVLYGATNQVAEVWDDTPDGRQSVKGMKIRFWTEGKQVEVLEGVLTAPTRGSAGMLKDL